jgi:membrane protein CcdC involved in cytochrome C biogenesis
MPDVPHLHVLSLISSIVGAVAVMIWRVSETRRPVTTRKIVIPPMGMATGFGMFAVPVYRVPWTWAGAAFLTGALLLAYPLIRSSRLVRSGDMIMLQRSNAFFAVLIVLAGIRLAGREYFDTLLTIQQTAALFFVLAFGTILRWRTQMLFEYRALASQAR